MDSCCDGPCVDNSNGSLIALCPLGRSGGLGCLQVAQLWRDPQLGALNLQGQLLSRLST
jgi:hypothetical protein